MRQKFVHYGPGVEQVEPDFDRTLQTVLDEMKQHTHGSIGGNREATSFLLSDELPVISKAKISSVMKSVPPRGSGWIRTLPIADCRFSIAN